MSNKEITSNLRDETLISEEFFQEPPHVFLTITWTLQDVYTVMAKQQIPVTWGQLQEVAEKLRKQLSEQSTAEGWAIMEVLLPDVIKGIID